MKKATLCFIVPLVLTLFHPQSARAAEDDFSVAVVKRTSCDQRAPKIKISLAKKAQRVGYGYKDSDTIYWLETGGVSAGSHRYALPRQPFGSTRQWVPVAAFKGDQGLYTAPMLTFSRPARVDCVAMQNLRITSYSTDVNVACDTGFDKMVVVTLMVTHNTPGYIVAPGVAELVKRSDRQLNSLPENTSFVGGADGARRIVEYYFFTGPKARFKLDPSENGIWPVRTSSNDVELLASLDAACMSQVP